ncbi:MAG: transglycosylase SLT domain-containing protein [Bacteroidales bacterium]|nr:transglycosylase SLT domain-containing protein [Bacteroidales bacterium]
MKKLITLIFVFVLTVFSLQAANDTIIVKSDSKFIERNLDSLTSIWYLENLGAREFDDSSSLEPVVEFPDSVYRERLSNIHSLVNLPYNSIVRNHIHVYTGKKRDKFRIMLGMRKYYFPMIEDIFDSYGLPTELKYIAVIESALNPNAVSRVGATGLWQFMYSTGRAYGLTINSIVDDRRDPVKSTHAAAKYLKDLYSIYDDWGLVIAAYNCGPGNVNKAIRRSGNRKDYWQIYYRLPRETRGYLPGYIAAFYSMNYYREHNINPLPVDFPLATDTVMVSRNLHVEQISHVMDIPLGYIRTLNPQYRSGIIPGRSKAMPVTLPLENVGDFISLQDSVASFMADRYLNKEEKSASPTRSRYVPPNIKGKAKLIYTVKEGDNLGFIAEWYNVGVSDLRYWNNIYRSLIRINQKLAIYVDPSGKDYYAEVNSLSFAEKQKRIGKPAIVKNTLSSGKEPDPGFVYHTVRYGDTVWDIAKKYSGVSATDILTLNGLGRTGKISVGQKLKIKKRS